MEDLEGEHLRRDLNEQDDLDNLDLQYDRQNEVFDYEKFNSDLLFAVQGLGGVKQVNNIEIYVKGPHCEDSIKDLIRLCRKDDADEPLTRKKLAIWKTFENDLIQLLLTQYQDKKLAFYLILLMVNLTEQPVKTCVIKSELKDALVEYKLCFLKPQVIGTLIQHLGDCIENHQSQQIETQKQRGKNEIKAHEQMIELIILLIKNILIIKDSVYTEGTYNEIRRNMHFHLLCQMKREHCFDLLIFLTQDFGKLDVLKKLDVAFLEIFYHIFASFDPEWLCSSTDSLSVEFNRLLEKDRQEKRKLQSIIPARHTRFQANFLFKRLLDDTKKLTTNPFATDKYSETNVTKHQLHKPIPRKILQMQEGIFRKRLHLELKVEMPLTHNISQENQYDEDVINTELTSFKSVMLQFALEFIKFSFCPLMEQCYNLLYSESEKLETVDTVYYFVVLGFGLKMARIVIFEHKAAELEIVDVAVALQLTQFQLIFSKLVKEVTQNKKKSFNLKNFYSTTYVFYELLQVIKHMSIDTSQQNRKNAQIMLQNVFHHDITKALRIGLDYCQKGILNDDVLKNIIELINIFFDLLEIFSKGKILTLQTDKLVKKKKKKPTTKGNKQGYERELENEMNDFIEKNPNEDNDDDDFEPNKEGSNQKNKKENNYDDEDDDDDDEDDDSPQFQERKYNLQSEFALLADYSILQKVLSLIDGDKMLTNTPNLNNAVYKFLQRVTDLLKADWIFFQADFLSIIQGICSHPEIKMRLENKKFIELFRKILRSLFDKMKQNKLLVVEMLFRFQDLTMKNSIMCNYEDLEKNNYEADNMLNEDQQIVIERKVWIEQEDRAIINNYETFKELSNVYEQLALVLNGLGFYDKSPMDIRRRVKYLKLHKGKLRAEKIFKEIYASKKISIKKALKELLETLKNEEIEKNNIELNDVQLFLESTFVNFKEYLFFVEEQYKELSDFERMLQIQDFCIVPYTVKDFDLIQFTQVQQLLESLGFRSPTQGQAYWRVPGFFKVSDIDLLKDKIDQYLLNPESLFENNNEENVEQEISEKKQKKKKKRMSENNTEEKYIKEEQENSENEQNNNYKQDKENKKKLKYEDNDVGFFMAGDDDEEDQNNNNNSNNNNNNHEQEEEIKQYTNHKQNNQQEQNSKSKRKLHKIKQHKPQYNEDGEQQEEEIFQDDGDNYDYEKEQRELDNQMINEENKKKSIVKEEIFNDYDD